MGASAREVDIWYYYTNSLVTAEVVRLLWKLKIIDSFLQIVLELEKIRIADLEVAP